HQDRLTGVAGQVGVEAGATEGNALNRQKFDEIMDSPLFQYGFNLIGGASPNGVETRSRQAQTMIALGVVNNTLNQRRDISNYCVEAELALALGLVHEPGRGFITDQTIALRCYQTAAEKGQVDAVMILAEKYEIGTDAPKNIPKAIKMYVLAGDLGRGQGYFNAGRIYFSGDGTRQNFKKSALYFKKAAVLGHLDAMNDLAAHYLTGRGVKKDYKEALRLFRQVADSGDPDGQSNVGIMYMGGYGMPRDIPEAKKWLSLAADQGHEEAIKALDAIR
ncbi:MAG: tetratricopeptide repeat protein, partial [Rhodospirillaceae bacterium]